MSNDWLEQLVNILHTGNMAGINMQTISMLPYPQEADVDLTLSLLERGTLEQPLFVLDHLVVITAENRATGMVRLALACLLSKVEPEFFQDPGNLLNIHSLLINMSAQELKELIDILRKKSFGKGFGSRPQKLIRKAMEAWTTEMLQMTMIAESRNLYALIRLVHPRYHGPRAEIIKELLGKK